MSIATLANAPTGYRASSRHSLGEIVTRFLTWRLERQLQAIEPAELEALQHAAQEFAAFSSRACLRADEIRVRCAQSLSAAARSTIGAVRAQLGTAQLRFCLRAMANALLAFGVTHMLAIPLHGQWAVPTAVAVIQMTIGGSLKAAAEYIIGTIGGALYATVVAALVPPSTEFSFALALGLAVGPLAYAAAARPSLRVAPVTAVLVLMISTKLGETPIGLAYDRLFEVAIGLLVALTVSFLVLPAPAHTRGLEEAARVLELMARALPAIIAGFADRLGPLQNMRLQDEVGDAVRSFAEVAAEARGERIANLAPDPDPAALARTLRRLRHDLVMLGRAAAEPLAARLAPRLQPLLAEVGAGARDYLRASADALTARRAGPTSAWVDDALAVYFAEVASMRGSGQLSALPLAERERIFALGFALAQLQQNLAELAGCVEDWARNPGWRGKACDLAMRFGMRRRARPVTAPCAKLSTIPSAQSKNCHP
jgi:uncharacterized membrane protein YccC